MLDQLLPPYEVAARQGRNARKRFRFTNDDVRVTPLDAHARLRNLLDLVEVATAGTLAMERVVHDEIARLVDGEIVFVDLPESELRGVSQEPWTLAIDSEFQTAATHAENVVALLDSLRALAGVERGQELAGRVDDGVADIWVLRQERP